MHNVLLILKAMLDITECQLRIYKVEVRSGLHGVKNEYQHRSRVLPLLSEKQCFTAAVDLQSIVSSTARIPSVHMAEIKEICWP